MLAYSKCLLQANFQYLAEIGTTLLYTDTDSNVFQGTPEQWELYKARFVPTKKTGGGMVLEGEFVKTRVLGPKKYATTGTSIELPSNPSRRSSCPCRPFLRSALPQQAHVYSRGNPSNAPRRSALRSSCSLDLEFPSMYFSWY